MLPELQTILFYFFHDVLPPSPSLWQQAGAAGSGCRQRRHLVLESHRESNPLQFPSECQHSYIWISFKKMRPPAHHLSDKAVVIIKRQSVGPAGVVVRIKVGKVVWAIGSNMVETVPLVVMVVVEVVVVEEQSAGTQVSSSSL